MKDYLIKMLNLATVSCDAAGEIDNYVLGRGKELDATNELVSRIKKFTSYVICIDPTKTMIFWEALKKQSDREIKQVDDLVFKISLAAQELNSIKTLPKKKLESLRTLCLNVSEESIVYRDCSHRYPSNLISKT